MFALVLVSLIQEQKGYDLYYDDPHAKRPTNERRINIIFSHATSSWKEKRHGLGNRYLNNITQHFKVVLQFSGSGVWTARHQQKNLKIEYYGFSKKIGKYHAKLKKLHHQ